MVCGRITRLLLKPVKFHNGTLIFRFFVRFYKMFSDWVHNLELCYQISYIFKILLNYTSCKFDIFFSSLTPLIIGRMFSLLSCFLQNETF